MRNFLLILLLSFSLPQVIYGQQKASDKGAESGTVIPTGVIMPFGGVAVPTGWLLCDGASLSRTTYAKLFAAIGMSWGTANGTSFNLPDLRGRFLRGRDGGTARDPNAATRTASATGGNTGDNVGSVQTNATAKNGLTVTNNAVNTLGQSATHNHAATVGQSSTTIYSSNRNKTDQAFSTFGAGGYISGDTLVDVTSHVHSVGIGNASGDHAHSVTSNVVLNTGDSETRPVNANVNYIIKI